MRRWATGQRLSVLGVRLQGFTARPPAPCAAHVVFASWTPPESKHSVPASQSQPSQVHLPTVSRGIQAPVAAATTGWPRYSHFCVTQLLLPCVQPWLTVSYGPSIVWGLSYLFLRKLNATGTNSQGNHPLPSNTKLWRPEADSARD